MGLASARRRASSRTCVGPSVDAGIQPPFEDYTRKIATPQRSNHAVTTTVTCTPFARVDPPQHIGEAGIDQAHLVAQLEKRRIRPRGLIAGRETGGQILR